MTYHPTAKDAYIDIECVSSNGESISYVRKYIRKDKLGVKAKKPKRTKLTNESEQRIKRFLKEKNKKR